MLWQLLVVVVLVAGVVGVVEAHYVETAKAMFSITIVACLILLSALLALLAYRFHKRRKAKVWMNRL